eukprot:992099-Prymnesium_polylepis.1
MEQKSRSVIDEAALKDRVREIYKDKQDTSMARVREKFGDSSAGLFELSLKTALGTPGVTAPFTYTGWMEKVSSSGTHWDKRWFVLLAGSYMLQYFKSDAAHREGAEPLGALDVRESYLS